MSLAATNAPAPGWYPDPGDPLTLRWWDGAGWTTFVADSPAVEPELELEVPPEAEAQPEMQPEPVSAEPLTVDAGPAAAGAVPDPVEVALTPAESASGPPTDPVVAAVELVPEIVERQPAPVAAEPQVEAAVAKPQPSAPVSAEPQLAPTPDVPFVASVHQAPPSAEGAAPAHKPSSDGFRAALASARAAGTGRVSHSAPRPAPIAPLPRPTAVTPTPAPVARPAAPAPVTEPVAASAPDILATLARDNEPSREVVAADLAAPAEAPAEPVASAPSAVAEAPVEVSPQVEEALAPDLPRPAPKVSKRMKAGAAVLLAAVAGAGVTAIQLAGPDEGPAAQRAAAPDRSCLRLWNVGATESAVQLRVTLGQLAGAHARLSRVAPLGGTLMEPNSCALTVHDSDDDMHAIFVAGVKGKDGYLDVTSYPRAAEYGWPKSAGESNVGIQPDGSLRAIGS